MTKSILRWTVRVLIFACILGVVTPSYAEDPEPTRGWKKKWIVTAIVLTAANAFDVYSSRGGNELNPLLRGSDGIFSPRRAVFVKSAASGGGLLLQMFLLKKMPEKNLYRSFALANIAAAGVTAASATRNYSAHSTATPEYLMRPGYKFVAPAKSTMPSSPAYQHSVLLREDVFH